MKKLHQIIILVNVDTDFSDPREWDLNSLANMAFGEYPDEVLSVEMIPVED